MIERNYRSALSLTGVTVIIPVFGEQARKFDDHLVSARRPLDKLIIKLFDLIVFSSKNLSHKIEHASRGFIPGIDKNIFSGIIMHLGCYYR
ncbi:MAG: hypothetical protein AB7H86_05880 [Blastocatellales bacterium]